MQQQQLGSSDLRVSRIGLGCMSLGTEQKNAVRLLHAALEQGINFFDTADLYQQGLNEEFVGTALAGKRHQAVLATKVGNRFVPGTAGWHWEPSKPYILSEVKESLRRLKTDYIDLYQLHGGTVDDPIDEIIEAFEHLRQEGLIRAYGISSIRPNVIREYATRSNIQTVMMQYSLLDRRPEEEMLSLLQQKRISVIGRGPLAQGLLTSNGKTKIKEGGYLDYTQEGLHEALTHLQRLSEEFKRPLSELALKYPLSHPAVAAIVPGASRLAQLEANLQAVAGTDLTKPEIDQLQSRTRANVYQKHR